MPYQPLNSPGAKAEGFSHGSLDNTRYYLTDLPSLFVNTLLLALLFLIILTTSSITHTGNQMSKHQPLLAAPRLFPAILGKSPGTKMGKIIDLTSKLEEINNIEHNKGSKIYPQNQVILDCIMPRIALKQECLCII